jgi:hypothetical protein
MIPFQFLLETDHRMVMSPAVIIMDIDVMNSICPTFAKNKWTCRKRAENPRYVKTYFSHFTCALKALKI